MIDYNELNGDGEKWELFARDFFESLGYTLDSPPDRGADGGKDLIISEQIKGKFSSYKFRWLVSCKNYSKSNKSVNDNDDERNLLDRCESFKTDGFIGFYSTIASSGLNNRLSLLKQSNKIKDFKIFDGKYIEHILMNYSFSNLIMRYFPESYKKIRPLHKLYKKFLELKCDYCGRDLFQDVENNFRNSVWVCAEKHENGVTRIEDCYVACKGNCDRILRKQYHQKGFIDGWRELCELATPLYYIHYVMCLINQLQNKERYIYSENALKKEKYLLRAMAQKVFHEVTEEERLEFDKVMQTGFL